MTLRSKLAKVLEEHSSKKLDDPDDALVVLEALMDSFTGKTGMKFALTLEQLRWYVNAGSPVRDMSEAIRYLLEVLGEL